MIGMHLRQSMETFDTFFIRRAIAANADAKIGVRRNIHTFLITRVAARLNSLQRGLALP
jgi:hypothetical protein